MTEPSTAAPLHEYGADYFASYNYADRTLGRSVADAAQRRMLCSPAGGLPRSCGRSIAPAPRCGSRDDATIGARARAH